MHPTVLLQLKVPGRPGGDQFSKKVPTDKTIKEIKCLVQDLTGIPAVEMQLSSRDRIMGDKSKIGHYLNGGVKTLSVMVTRLAYGKSCHTIHDVIIIGGRGFPREFPT